MRRPTRAALVVLALSAASVAIATPVAATGDHVGVDPSSGPVGTQVTVSGVLTCADQAPGESDVLVRFTDPDAALPTGTNLGTATYGDGGAFSTTVTVPSELAQLDLSEGISSVPVEPGTYKVEVSCTFVAAASTASEGAEAQTSVPTVLTPFTVTESPTTTTTSTSTTSTTAPTTTTTADGTSPTVPSTPPADAAPLTGLSTRVVAPGGTITIDEGGFTPGSTVDVVLYSTPAVLSAHVPVDVDGHVRTTVRIPTDTAPGDHTLVLYGEPQAKAGTIQVSGPPASAVGANLPVTGSADTGWMVAVGAGLLAAGAAAAAAARRTHREG